jgi:succinate-semialdehyde dehydrogenase/glutarate-semialdehyde dehydrogenase
MKTPDIASRNPATGALLRSFPALSSEDLESRVASADRAYRKTLSRPLAEVAAARKRVLLRAAEILETRADEFAHTITLEMGKTLASAKAEVLKCAKCCRYYAEHGPKMLEAEPAKLDSGSRAEVRYEPLGTVLAVMPWNFPFWQVFRCAAPILLSGNSMLLKHASNVPQSALAIEAVWQEALRAQSEDPTAFATLLLPSSRIDALIPDARIRGVTLTGSEGAGRKVAETAGRSLKKTVLELGGSDPFVVFQSADLERAISVAVDARTLANGQSCIAAKRFLVHESIYARFRDGFVEKIAALPMGDPLEPKTKLGPLAMPQIRADLHALVEDARTNGGKVLLGGILPEGPGNFYPGTVIENVTPKAKLYREEAFGPLAALYSFRTLDEAISLANATPFGLGASIWTTDRKDVEICARRIESGQLFVNELVASDPAVPFGGVKDSGYGRELGIFGVREWTIARTLVVGGTALGAGATE